MVEEIRAGTLTKDIPIIMLSLLSKEEERVAGLERGADDYIAKPFSPKELKIKVDLLLSRTKEIKELKREVEEKKKGKTIVFLGAKGGVGTTTLAINTASAIKSLGKEVCACDMNPNFGAFQFLLNIQTNKNIAILLRESSLDLDKKLLESYLAVHKESNMKVLISPNQNQSYTIEEIKKIKYIMGALKSHYDFTIVDAGCTINSLSSLLIDICDYSVVCSTLDLLSLYNLKILYNFLKENEFDSNKFKIVVNNVNTYSDLKVDAVKKQIYFPLIENIQNDGANFMRAINKGQPYISLFPKSKSTNQIKNLAAKIIEMSQQS